VLRSTMATFEKPPPVGNGRRPDAIFLDIGMPHIDGFELAQKLKLGFPGVSVVAISGHSSDEHRKRAPHAGFDGLRYPVELTTGATYRLGRIFDGIDVSPPQLLAQHWRATAKFQGALITKWRRPSGVVNRQPRRWRSVRAPVYPSKTFSITAKSSGFAK
jgi:CheY-like chemotaxis protein